MMAESQQAGSRPRRGLPRDDIKALCDRVLRVSKADQTRVVVNSGVRGFSRTAMNRVTTAGSTDDTAVRITCAFGRRTASVDTNRLDGSFLEKSVGDCEALARLSPEDPEYVKDPGPQTYVHVNGYYRTTAELTTEERAKSAALGIRGAQQAG